MQTTTIPPKNPSANNILGRGGVTALLLGALLVVSLWLLWPGIHGSFLFDDFPNLQNLREVGDVFTRESIGRYLALWQGNPGRPLAALSFLVEDHAWPTDPEAFKRDNLLLHLLVGLGVFALSRRLARLYVDGRDADSATPVGAGHAPDRSAGTGRGHDTRLDDWAALAATAMWLLHPMQLSATMLVVQRMTLLANGLIVAGLLLYLRAVCDNPRPGWAATLCALLVLGTFGAIAFLAKENGPLIFVYATALNLTLLAPTLERFPTGSRRLLWAGTGGATLLLVAALFWQVRDAVAAYASRDFTLEERFLSEGRILWNYLAGVLLPRLGGGGIFHDDYLISHGLLEPWTTLPAALGIVGTLTLALRYGRRWPLAGFAVLWFVAGHLIESTVLPLELYFEHRNYLAMLGPVLAVCARLLSYDSDLKRPLYLLLLLWIALCGFIGHQSARLWGNEGALAEVWVKEHQNSPRAWQFRASVQVKRGEYSSAYNSLDNAIERNPKAQELHLQRALLDCISGRATSETFERLTQSAHVADWARAVPDMITALRARVGHSRCAGALTPSRFYLLVQALLTNPHYADRQDIVSHLEDQLARMYLDNDQPDASLEHFEASYAATPNPAVAINKARVLLYLQRPEEALRALDKSDAAPRQRFKRWLYDYHRTSDELRMIAHKMQIMQRVGNSR